MITSFLTVVEPSVRASVSEVGRGAGASLLRLRGE